MSVLLKKTELAEPLFKSWQESCIWSCLQGIMGKIYTDHEAAPKSAMAVLGDFCFLAGEPDEDLVKDRAAWTKPDFTIMVPQNELWARLIRQCHGEKAKQVTRYAIKKEPGIFDRKKLEKAAASLPEEYTLRLIDEELYYRSLQEDWSRDWVANYENYALYERLGLGVVALRGDEIVSGVSSYSSYDGGIEIEIGTKEAYRRKGLAYACAARIILECMDRGLYPNWDAQNKWSVCLAEKLGYHYSHDYTAFEVR